VATYLLKYPRETRLYIEHWNSGFRNKSTAFIGKYYHQKMAAQILQAKKNKCLLSYLPLAILNNFLQQEKQAKLA
jgi:hypothetical protein